MVKEMIGTVTGELFKINSDFKVFRFSWKRWG